MLNVVLWILRTGIPWQDLASRYGAYQTCHQRFHQWQCSGILDACYGRYAKIFWLAGSWG